MQQTTETDRCDVDQIRQKTCQQNEKSKTFLFDKYSIEIKNIHVLLWLL